MSDLQDSGRCDWTPDTSPDAFARNVALIRDSIAAGDTYQVNYSFRLEASDIPEPGPFFRALADGQRRGFKAYVEAEDFAICSASPELFFHLDGRRITCRPMKGTAPRGLSLQADVESGRTLQASEKNRAENIMIVDMIRNDLGRVAAPGSVETTSLFDVERHETLWQMTSTVRATTSAGYVDLFRALFPCASVTGAPKVRTMQIISELERSPRGIYTGAIGYVAPGRKACFNVAIRTAFWNKAGRRAEYGTGAGIVWDSHPAQEWEECMTKALVLRRPGPPFELLETLRWGADAGFFLLDEHLARLGDSAAYFDVPFDRNAVRTALLNATGSFPSPATRVRLLVDSAGTASVAHETLSPTARPWRVALASHPVRSDDVFLYHKTTRREVYDRARAAAPGCDDVILWNEREEITESTVANVVLRLDGKWVTPPVHCGLLPGVMRRHLLESGSIEEDVIPLTALRSAEAVFLVNSVRRWIPVEPASGHW
jgi:para-aminobenzoate synthetase/4-amino-4-deoxychorismate lyase